MSPPSWWWRRSALLHFSLLLLHTTPLLAQSACTAQCGSFQIPFPFYLLTNATSNNSASTASTAYCPLLSDAFSLSCINSSSLFLTIAFRTYRVLHFFPDGLLVDFPNTTLCRRYNDLRSFPFSANPYFAISADNVLDLYDCDDSSLCKTDCDATTLVPACDGGQPAGYPSCCYPLSDRTSSWRPGNSLAAAFSQYGCRGFTSWVAFPGGGIGKRGVKLEWAVPRNSSVAATCAANADAVNATSVAAGIRCQCSDGFSGDGFLGCLKSCFKDGKEVHGNDCYQSKHGRKKAIILAGVLTSTLSVVSLTAIFLLKRKIRSDKFISEQPHCQSNIAGRSRLFTYHELEEATKGFGEGQKIVDGGSSAVSTLYGGVVMGGLRVAVQKVQRESESETENENENERELVLRLQALSAVSHRNMARIVGWSVDAGCTPLIVYDYPENGTLRDHLRRRAGDTHAPLDWYKRLNIAAETACTLAFLHHEVSPPVFHHDLHSGCIFLDMGFSVKLAGFELRHGGLSRRRRNDVCSLGLVLLEIITGSAVADCSGANLQRGKLEEMVDPSLYYHEQPSFRREQIEVLVDLATRCLLFGGDGKLGMVDVARELLHIAKDGVAGGSSRRGPALEETFSNSSLLQMISMSPDSICVP